MFFLNIVYFPVQIEVCVSAYKTHVWRLSQSQPKGAGLLSMIKRTERKQLTETCDDVEGCYHLMHELTLQLNSNIQRLGLHFTGE